MIMRKWKWYWSDSMKFNWLNRIQNHWQIHNSQLFIDLRRPEMNKDTNKSSATYRIRYWFLLEFFTWKHLHINLSSFRFDSSTNFWIRYIYYIRHIFFDMHFKPTQKQIPSINLSMCKITIWYFFCFVLIYWT